jgi:hypothetical protein
LVYPVQLCVSKTSLEKKKTEAAMYQKEKENLSGTGMNLKFQDPIPVNPFFELQQESLIIFFSNFN